MIAIDEERRRDELVLPQTRVFEDITPRLADLDGDGRNEVVAIRTDVSAGAAVAVYHMVDGKLKERAATAPLRLANRWLSLAAIADFRGDGRRQIAVVKTPHIGGILEILALRGGRAGQPLSAAARLFDPHHRLAHSQPFRSRRCER